MYHRTLADLMQALGFDRSYASRLKERHGIVLTKTPMGYSEAEARIALAAAGIECVPPDPNALATAAASSADDLDLPGSCSYDHLVKTGRFPLPQALRREQVREAELVNEKHRIEIAKIKGDLVPREAVRKKVETITLACLEALAYLPDLAAEAVPADQRPAARKQAREWVDAIRQRMADVLGTKARGAPSIDEAAAETVRP